MSLLTTWLVVVPGIQDINMCTSAQYPQQPGPRGVWNESIEEEKKSPSSKTGEKLLTSSSFSTLLLSLKIVCQRQTSCHLSFLPLHTHASEPLIEFNRCPRVSHERRANLIMRCLWGPGSVMCSMALIYICSCPGYLARALFSSSSQEKYYALAWAPLIYLPDIKEQCSIIMWSPH